MSGSLEGAWPPSGTVASHTRPTRTRPSHRTVERRRRRWRRWRPAVCRARQARRSTASRRSATRSSGRRLRPDTQTGDGQGASGVCVWALLRRLREWGMRRGRRRARPPAQLFRVWQAGRFLTPPPPPPPPGQTTRLAVRARWPAGGERGASGPKQARARRRWGAPAAPSGPVPCGRVLGRQRPGDGWRRNWGLPHKAGRRRG